MKFKEEELLDISRNTNENEYKKKDELPKEKTKQCTIVSSHFDIG